MWPFASTIVVFATVIYCIILSHSCHIKKGILCIHSNVKIDNILSVWKKNYIANYNLKNKVLCLHSLYSSLSATMLRTLKVVTILLIYGSLCMDFHTGPLIYMTIVFRNHYWDYFNWLLMKMYIYWRLL